MGPHVADSSGELIFVRHKTFGATYRTEAGKEQGPIEMTGPTYVSNFLISIRNGVKMEGEFTKG